MIKKITLVISLSVASVTVCAQQSNYSILTTHIAELDHTHMTTSTLQQLSNDFERIALANEKDWLANYYAAYSYLQLAYLAQGEQIDLFCDQAEIYLKNAEKLAPTNSEVHALYAYLYGAKVNADPMTRGAEMGRKSANYINLSIQADPQNPRPYLIRAMGIYYTPKAFGGGSEKAIPYLQESIEKFNKFTPESKNAPHWGKALAEQLLKDCLKK